MLILPVVGAVLLAHGPALSARALSFDDQQYLLDNYLVRNPSWASVARFLSEVRNPSTVNGYYQPLAMLSLMADCAMGGGPENLAPFHRTSLALHAANTALIIVLLYLLLGNAWAAAFAGLLFGVHPMTVETIPWVGERKTLLATFFALTSLVAYVRYVRTGRRRWYGLALAVFVLALLSKPTTTPLPLLLLLLDFWPLDRLSRKAALEKVPFLAVAGLSAVITYVSQKTSSGVYDPGALSPLRVPLTLCHNIIFYPWKMLRPVNLSSHYPFPEPMDLSEPMVRAGVVGTLLLIPLLLLSLRWTRALLTGWLFFFVAIFPTLGIIGFTDVIASDKYAYFPVVGFLLVLALFLTRLWGQKAHGGRLSRRWMLAAVVLVLSGSEIAATRRYLADWQDSEKLFGRMLRLAPDSAALYDNLGTVLNRQGRLDDAIRQHTQALRLKPDFALPHYNVANALAMQGKFDEAIEHYVRALHLDPRCPEAHDNLAVALARRGRLDEAVRHSREALRLKRTDPKTHNNLANMLAMQGNLDEAVVHYREALSLDPHYAEAHKNLAFVLTGLGKHDDAAVHFAEALRLNPGDATLRDQWDRLRGRPAPLNTR